MATGCTTIVNNESEWITIVTKPEGGATCALQNNKGKWYVTSTPDKAFVIRSFHDLYIVCNKPGYKNADKYVHASTPFQVFGNGVFGGLYGAGIDMGGGAAYAYPDKIIIPMTKEPEVKNKDEKKPAKA